MNPIAQRLLDIQAAASAAESGNDRAAGAALLGPVSDCLAAALAAGEPGLIGLAHQMKARVQLCAGDASSAVAECLQGEAALVDAASSSSVLAAHPRLEQLLELRRVRLQAVAAQNDSTGLVELAQATIQILETRRAHLHDPFQRAAFLAGRTLFYELFAFGSFKLGRWDDLLTAMDLLKSRATYVQPTGPRPAEDPIIVAKLAAANAVLAGAPADSPEYRSAAEQRRLLISLRAVTRASDDEGAAVDAIPRLTVARVQAALASDEAVVGWVWITHAVLLVLAIDAAGVHAERIILGPLQRSELDAYVLALREQRLDPTVLDAVIARLTDALMPPATRDIIARCRRLILSPHRELHVLPFHAARSGGSWLIEHCAIRYAATLGSVLLPVRTAAQAGGLFALGIDRFDVPGELWPTLEHAESEVASVAAIWKRRSLPVTTLMGPGASVAAWRGLGSGLARFRCLHIATHGASVFDREAKNDPLAARLILQDGVLDALALSQLRLDADVVVLSACNSGQRALGGRGLDEYPGDDNFGVQSALLEAGARGVIGALWPVLDEVAPLIMPALHEGLAEGRPADLALQAAVVLYLGRPDARREAFAWGQMFLSSMR